MNSTPRLPNGKVQAVHPGVYANPHGGYIVHVKVNDRASSVLNGTVSAEDLAPADTRTLAGMTIFEDCVAVALQNGHTILLHASEQQVKGSVLRFYHADGTLWRVVALEQLNPGWVSGRYVFRSDLRKFEQRTARIRSHPARSTRRSDATLWATGGWTGGVVYTATPLVWRIEEWQHSPLTTAKIAVPNEDQVQALEEYPPDVQMLLTLQEEGVQKTSYQLGGLTLVLTYVERIGLTAAVNRYCQRVGDISEGTVMTVHLSCTAKYRVSRQPATGPVPARPSSQVGGGHRLVPAARHSQPKIAELPSAGRHTASSLPSLASDRCRSDTECRATVRAESRSDPL